MTLSYYINSYLLSIRYFISVEANGPAIEPQNFILNADIRLSGL